MGILDANLDTEFESKPTLINWLPYIILWAGIIYFITIGFITYWQVTIAAISLLFATIVSFRKFDAGVKVLIFVLFAAVIEAIRFFPIQIPIGVGINSYFLLGIEVIAFSVLLLHYYVNKSILKPFIKSFFKATESDKKAIVNKRVKNFKEKYANRSKTELEQIATNEKMIPAARKAATELLEEKLE